MASYSFLFPLISFLNTSLIMKVAYFESHNNLHTQQCYGWLKFIVSIYGRSLIREGLDLDLPDWPIDAQGQFLGASLAL